MPSMRMSMAVVSRMTMGGIRVAAIAFINGPASPIHEGWIPRLETSRHKVLVR